MINSDINNPIMYTGNNMKTFLILGIIRNLYSMQKTKGTIRKLNSKKPKSLLNEFVTPPFFTKNWANIKHPITSDPQTIHIRLLTIILIVGFSFMFCRTSKDTRS